MLPVVSQTEAHFGSGRQFFACPIECDSKPTCAQNIGCDKIEFTQASFLYPSSSWEVKKCSLFYKGGERGVSDGEGHNGDHGASTKLVDKNN